MSCHRVVITGIGVVSPNGIGAGAFADACLAGKSGLSRPAGDAFGDLKTSAVAAVREFDPLTVMTAIDARRVPRMIPLALAASREAAKDHSPGAQALGSSFCRRFAAGIGNRQCNSFRCQRLSWRHYHNIPTTIALFLLPNAMQLHNAMLAEDWHATFGT